MLLRRLLLARASLISLTTPSHNQINSTTPTLVRHMATENRAMNNSTAIPSVTTKTICFLRHGQALHNPRAEEAKDNGCSHETFLNLMHEDDAFDARLTALGEAQATNAGEMYSEKLESVELVVSSPLSRAIKTADLAAGPHKFTNRVCVEHFREINGWLLNAKRRTRIDLQERFHESWDFNNLAEEDENWTETLETEESCAERGYLGLLWLKDRQEEKILTVAHGGLLRFIAHHSNIEIIDERPEHKKRFGNCELREYSVSWTTESERESVTEERPLVILREIID
jgi:broad specificity phosphatase PhoE